MACEFHCVVMGDNKVGKSSFIESYCGNVLKFMWNHHSIRFNICEVNSSDTPISRKKKLKKADAIICVFALYSISSLKSVKTVWWSLIRENVYKKNVFRAVVGTHLDLRYAFQQNFPIWSPMILTKFPIGFKKVVMLLACIYVLGPKKTEGKCYLSLLPKQLLFNIISYLPPNTNPSPEPNIQHRFHSSSKTAKEEILLPVNISPPVASLSIEVEAHYLDQSIHQINLLRAKNMTEILETKAGQAFAINIGADYYGECSPLTQENVAIIYSDIVSLLYKNKMEIAPGCTIH